MRQLRYILETSRQVVQTSCVCASVSRNVRFVLMKMCMICVNKNVHKTLPASRCLKMCMCLCGTMRLSKLERKNEWSHALVW